MEYRNNRNFWLKLAGVSVSYSVVVSVVVVLWKQQVVPELLSDGDGAAWLIFVALSSVIIWGILPAVAALLLLGRLYGKNFIVGFWRPRKDPGVIGVRLFAMLVAAVSGSLSIWLVIGPILGEESPTYAFPMLLFIVTCAALLADSIVHGERTLAERKTAHAETVETGA